jgi:hypothetical protein
MSDTAKENVVSLDDYGQMRRGLGNGPGTQALREVRDLASSRLKQHVGRMMEKIDDALFARAEKAESNMVQTRYFDAMRELRIIRQDIEDDFIAGFNARFNQGVPRPGQGNQSFNLNFEGDSALGLVDKDDMEEDLAITNMVIKTRGTCTQSLYSLDKRIGFLIRDPDLERWQNPLGPEAVCDAFRTAAKRIETGLEIRLVIFKLFDQHVICYMDELYKEINQLLIKLGVLPEIRATVRRSNRPLRPPQAPVAPGAGLEPPAPGHEPGPYMTGGQDHSGAYMTGGQDYSGAYMNPGVYPVMHPGLSAGGYYPGGGTPASLSALTFLQQGGVAAANDHGAGFSVDPSALSSGQTNILRGIKASTAFQELGKAGDMTIDIVAMLFDYILDDPNIPDVMRALIGRLQIPLLKVALLEREFFTRKSHPARQLLNRLAATAVGWDEQLGNDDPLYRKVESIVQTIIDKFEDDTSLFAQLLEDLDEFLRQEEERAELRAERSAKVMEGQERLEAAKSTTLEEIEPRVSGEMNLDFVREFVTRHWKNLLFIICARQGKDSDAWQQAVATMDELIWSVKPKHTLAERKRLVAMQPTLLSNLRSGMERLSIPATERDDFIARLVHAHGRTAVNKTTDEDGQEGRGETPGASTENTAADNVQERAEPVGKASPAVTSAKPCRQAEQPASINDEYSERVRMLKSGTWIEINSSDGKGMRAKLSWISPITGTYLFTDRQGLKAGNFTLDELARLLRSRQARVLSSTPLMDRAVGMVLKQYQQK